MLNVHQSDFRAGIKRASHRNVIEDNVFYETIFEWPWDTPEAASRSSGVAPARLLPLPERPDEAADARRKACLRGRGAP